MDIRGLHKNIKQSFRGDKMEIIAVALIGIGSLLIITLPFWHDYIFKRGFLKL
jgi:hypothetical protein